MRSKILVMIAARAAILVSMGYNPHRRFRARVADYIVLGTGLVVVVALVLYTAVG